MKLRELWRFLVSRYLVVSSVPLLVAQGVTIVLGLGRNTILTNFLSKEDFGALNYLTGWLALISLLSLPGLSAAIAQYVARGHWEAIRLGIRRRLLAGLLPMLVLVVFGLTRFGADQNGLLPIVWLLTALFFPAAHVLTLVGNILSALKRFRWLAGYQVGQSAAFLAAAAIGVWAWSFQPLAGIVLFQWLLLSGLNISFLTKVGRVKGEYEHQPLLSPQRKQFYRFGTHLTALIAIGQIQSRIGALLLGGAVSLAALADYAIGDIFFEQMRSLWNLYYSVSYPRLITLNKRDRWRQVARETKMVTPAFTILTGLIGIALSFIIPWLFSAKYASSLIYVWILLLAFICSIPGGFFEIYFQIEEVQQALYHIRLTAALVGVVLPPLLLLVWGPLGIPLSRVVANLVYSATGFILYYRQKDRVI